MKSGMTVTLDKLPDVIRALALLERKEVLIGIPSDTTSRDTGTINNAAIGYLNEYGGVIHHPGGTRYINDAVVNGVRRTAFVGRDFKGDTKATAAHTITIPARPHLVPGVESVTPRAIKMLEGAAQSALSGNINAVDKAFDAVGLMGQNAVRGLIRSTLAPPLAWSTLRSRRARGRSGFQPLINTGEYLKSITYVIRQRK